MSERETLIDMGSRLAAREAENYLRQRMKVIFLDIDGVLNDHTRLPSNYCGMRSENVRQLNRILDAVPEAKIVVSSAWRYMILRGDMTIKGFEYLLLVHGVKAHDRVCCNTEADGELHDEPSHFDAEAWQRAGLKWRRTQIEKWIDLNKPFRHVVLDDLPLDMPNLVRTTSDVGLTPSEADAAIRILT